MGDNGKNKNAICVPAHTHAFRPPQAKRNLRSTRRSRTRRFSPRQRGREGTTRPCGRRRRPARIDRKIKRAHQGTLHKEKRKQAICQVRVERRASDHGGGFGKGRNIAHHGESCRALSSFSLHDLGTCLLDPGGQGFDLLLGEANLGVGLPCVCVWGTILSGRTKRPNSTGWVQA